MQTTFSHPAAPFWDRIAPKYARQPIKDPMAYAAKLDAIRARLTPTDRVLEIGCGTGSTAITLAPLVAEYTATDVSPGMIEIAETKHPGTDTLRFAAADAAATIEGAPFDTILSFSLLHLVDDLDAVLRSIHDQLRPGGLFISKTVCLGETNIAIRALVRGLRLIGVAPPVRVFGAGELRAAIERAGFDIDYVTHFASGTRNPFIVARRVP